MIYPWRPKASLANLRLRAQVLAKIRHFFAERNILEVETPLLSNATVTTPFIQSFVTRYYPAPNSHPVKLFLQTSPEYAMKRLLAAGSGSIYQICKSFRNEGEAGRWHNPEFTMLEWYREGFNHFDLMNDTDELLQLILQTESAERITYQELFKRYLNIDPLSIKLDELKHKAHAYGLKLTDQHAQAMDRDSWLYLLMADAIEPHIGFERPLFVYDFPASQAALARLNPNNPHVAERFEVYVNGMELANGFHELSDIKEQRQRFEQEIQQRQKLGLAEIPLDEYFLDALEHGLPNCAGIALGIDRLVMIAAKTQKLADVISFTVDNA